MAKGLSGERRREVLKMADIWEALALDGEKAADEKPVQSADQVPGR